MIFVSWTAVECVIATQKSNCDVNSEEWHYGNLEENDTLNELTL